MLPLTGTRVHTTSYFTQTIFVNDLHLSPGILAAKVIIFIFSLQTDSK